MELIRNSVLLENSTYYKLKIIDCGHAYVNTHWVRNVIQQSFTRLYFTLNGSATYYYLGKKYTFLPGICYLLPTGFTFYNDCDKEMEQLFFHISLVNENGYDMLRYIKEPLTYVFSKKTERSLLEVFEPTCTNPELKLQAILLNSLNEIFDSNKIILPKLNYSTCVKLALKYIHKQCSIAITLQALSEKCFVSQTTLSKKFKTELGTSIGSYIDDIVFMKAKNLLEKNELPISSIAEELGFCDQFYFSKRFKQKYNQSPQAYRKNNSK